MPLSLPLLRLLALSSLTFSVALAYTDAADGFSATAPTGWKQSSYPGTSVLYLAPKMVASFNTNINVLVQALPAGVSLQAYDEATLQQIKSVITDGKLISKKAVTLNGVRATQLNYTGRQGKFRLFFTQTYAVVGTKAYVLTGTTLQGQEATLTPAMNDFVRTFKIKR